MQKLTFCTAVFMFFWVFTPAQKTYNMGLSMDDESYEKAPYTSANIQVDDGRRFSLSQVDLSPYCPEIRHQGDIASCVGWSVGYGAMTIERALKNKWTDKQLISENAHSALFVFNQISGGECDKGISLIQALDLLQNKGNCLARDFDFDVNDCRKNASEGLFQRAAGFRITDYVRLFPLDAAPEEKIKKVKLVLAQHKPVAIGMRVLQNFYDIDQGDQTWWPAIGNTTYAGGHAMVVVGYDDNKFHSPGRNLAAGERGAFKLMNSWGKNWGQEGFIWIRYSDFATYCRYAFALMLEEGAPIQWDTAQLAGRQTVAEPATPAPASGKELQNIAGSFGFRQYVGWDNGPVFKEASVKAVDHEYQLAGDWKVGDQFQLYTKSEFDNGYIYVLSVDQERKAQVHFPRSAEYDARFEDQHESALILTGGSVLTIPSHESALQLSHAGREHLIVLFSTKKIKASYIELLCRELSGHKEDLTRHLHKMLDRFMVPLTDITYQQQLMGFEVSTRSEGKIVPIVLTVDVSG